MTGVPKKAETGRCWWCGDDPLYVAYHDEEWGVPLRDDAKLFELLVLEGFQAGLSWITILRKRENFRKAFLKFDAERMAKFAAEDFARLMGDAGIVRNRLKVEGSALNARAYLKVREEVGSFHEFVWGFTGGKTLRDPAGMDRSKIRATSAESDAMSKALLKRGFKFVGSTICYAFMQAGGMVDDHLEGCWKYRARKGKS